MIKLVECPRDAMQGIHEFIPTHLKIKYINKLLKVGFHTIDFGSFVSPRAIPQMQDTAEVLQGLELDSNSPSLLAIIANIRGAGHACSHNAIKYLGYPFSISQAFQQRNTNRGIDEAYADVQEIQKLCMKHGKELVLYISMGFGNPYGDPWAPEIVGGWISKFKMEGIKIFSLADTVGTADVKDISHLFADLIPEHKDLEIGCHFHSTPMGQREKLEAAYTNGCRRFDSAMLGFGGCPMAKDDLTGNINTEYLLQFLDGKNEETAIDKGNFEEARMFASELFTKYSH